MLSEKEILTARFALKTALDKGAQMARVILTRTQSDSTGTVDGKLDKVAHSLDRSLTLSLFVDGRFGTYSTNKLVDEDVSVFIDDSISMTRLLAEDPCRSLPDPARCCQNARTGMELGHCDPSFPGKWTPCSGASAHPDVNVVSTETELSENEQDTILLDSNGIECRDRETSYEYYSEVTVQDEKGNKYSGFWWDANPLGERIDRSRCDAIALEKAVTQMHPRSLESGRYNVVVDSEVASRLVTPLLSALSGFSIQQGNSFLTDSVGKKMFSEGLTIIDDCLRPAENGSRLFDSEGVATEPRAVIENGVVKEYFISEYISRKMKLAPTHEDCAKAHLMPWPKPGLGKDELMQMCGSGLYVTGFNGGNSNPATGDFSFGVEGLWFENGRIAFPVRELLATGNLITLWNNLIAAGDDARPCMLKLIPTLAFAKIDING